MKPGSKKKAPEIILREGKPAAVILDIDRYREILERLVSWLSGKWSNADFS